MDWRADCCGRKGGLVKILGIDPGPTTSGVVLYDTEIRAVVMADGALETGALLDIVRSGLLHDLIACERIEAMYAHVGKETVRTIEYIGRLQEAAYGLGTPFWGKSPQDIKKAVCGTAAAKDGAVRQALIDQIGPQGKKADPGPTYGVSKHAWRALAAAHAYTLTSKLDTKTG